MGTFQISSDAKTGIVDIKIIGFLSDSDAYSYVKALAKISTAVKQRYGYLLVLVDNRDSAILSESARRIMLNCLVNHKSSMDRTAIIVKSALGKMQVKRSINSQQRIFTSIDEALYWLETEKNQISEKIRLNCRWTSIPGKI